MKNSWEGPLPRVASPAAKAASAFCAATAVFGIVSPYPIKGKQEGYAVYILK
jgi:hypothetical protein